MRGWKLALAIAATALFSAASPAREPDPMPVEQLVKSPPLEFRHVLVTGQVDNCSGFNCNLCPAEMTRDSAESRFCLSLSFDGFEDPDSGAGASRLMDSAFRFATVVLDADYDPTCLTAKEVVCLDRASVIVNAKVLKVLSRKAAKDGITFGRLGRLEEAGEVDKGAMQKIVVPDAAADEEGRTKFFVAQDYPYLDADLIAVGLGCYCLEESCERSWPQHLILGLDTPANPFRCIQMEKHSSGWRISIFN